MKLVRFATNDTGSKPGVMVDDAVFALSDLLPEASTDMIGVIERWEEIKGPVRETNCRARGLANSRSDLARAD